MRINYRSSLHARWLVACRHDNQRVMREVESELVKHFSTRTFRKSMRLLHKYALNWQAYLDRVA